jgi:alkylhydroperoxidase family enzyme
VAHVQLSHKADRLIGKLAYRYARRRFGRVVEPVQAAAHHSGVLVAWGGLETLAQRGWRRLDPRLRWLAIQASAGHIGCSWCTDYGFYEGIEHGMEPHKVRAVERWRTSEVFDARERTVLEYAEAATRTPATISVDMVQRLHRYFSEAEIVELAAWVALENLRSRFNAGLGLRSQGFSETCTIPLHDDVSAVS